MSEDILKSFTSTLIELGVDKDIIMQALIKEATGACERIEEGLSHVDDVLFKHIHIGSDSDYLIVWEYIPLRY